MSDGGISNQNEDAISGGVEFDPAGRPFVAWSAGSFPGPWGVLLRAWTGSAWAGLGSSDKGAGLSTGGTVYWPVAGRDAAGQPAVAWMTASGGPGAIVASHWTGSSWEGLGGLSESSPLSEPTQHGDLVTVASGPTNSFHAVWQENGSLGYRIRHAYYDGVSWKRFGQGGVVASSSTTLSRPHVLVVDALRPVVVWQATTPSDSAVHLKQWNGSEWRELAGSASGGGVSGDLSQAGLPRLAHDEAGRLWVVFSADDTQGRNIYARVLAGSAWTDAPGVQRPGGLSMATTGAEYPVLLVRPRDPGGLLVQEPRTVSVVAPRGA